MHKMEIASYSDSMNSVPPPQALTVSGPALVPGYMSVRDREKKKEEEVRTHFRRTQQL